MLIYASTKFLCNKKKSKIIKKNPNASETFPGTKERTHDKRNYEVEHSLVESRSFLSKVTNVSYSSVSLLFLL